MKIKTVLCPIDFSPLSEKELGLATQICERFDAQMIVHHNIDTVPPIYLANAWMYSETHMYPEEEKEAIASKTLESILEKLPKSIKREGKITFGSLDESILFLVEKLPADIIVMGTHGASKPGHASGTDRVLTQSPCPVLTTCDPGVDTLFAKSTTDACSRQPVLVPMDFSQHSLGALEYGLSLMDELPLELHLLHVEAPMALDDLKALGHFLDFEDQKHRRMDASLDRLKMLIPTNYLSRVKFEVRMGSVVEEIIAHAASVQAVFIIMGAHNKNVIDHLIFGAHSRGVLHKSPCPVWLVPKKESHAQSWVEVAAGRGTGG